MDLDKIFYRKFLKGAFSDPVKVRYWDGTEEDYGDGQPKFEIIFNSLNIFLCMIKNINNISHIIFSSDHISFV